MRLIVTGGYGFIGSAYIRHAMGDEAVESLVNVDCLTYAANPEALETAGQDHRYRHVKADIADAPAMEALVREVKPDAIVNLAAETHVDRSIDGPAAFVRTNVLGTAVLLEAARAHWQALDPAGKAAFRFHHVSTDEVFGSLGPDDPRFCETTPYDPSSPYSASKAGADHLVRAWGHTYGMPMLVSNCSNNYGPWQFPEKLIPLMIAKALKGEPLPVYGKGENVRDWLHVDDHARALWTILKGGKPGETYVVGGNAERRNIDVVHTVCDALDRLAGLLPSAAPRRGLVTHVTDRPGHDMRYAIDAAKIERELGWRPRETFDQGLEATVAWYLTNRAWWERVVADKAATQRIGLKA